MTTAEIRLTRCQTPCEAEGTGRNKHKVYDYVDLNGDLDSLRENLKAYYRSHILDKMLAYELVK